VTAICLVVWRLLDQIPVSDVTNIFIQGRLLNLGEPGFFGAIGPKSIPFASWSLARLGIGPYVEALIVMSVAAAFSARLREMAGNRDRRASIARWTRALAMGLALSQAYAFTLLYQNGFPPVFGPLDWSARLAIGLALAGGTALMILLADALDEFGLGFGYGAVIFYALGSLGLEVHRIADYFASAPSLEALFRPVAVWTAFTVGLTVATVAVLLAVRRVATTELRLLWSGVLRPVQFAGALLSVPLLAANYYYARYPAEVQWIYANWRSYGANLSPNVGYLLIYAGLLVGFALFVAAIDDRLMPVPSPLRPAVIRLALLGGLFLALAVIAIPVADRQLTRATGLAIPFSGADVLLVVAVVLFAVRAIEGYRPVVPFTASPSGLP